MAGALPLVNSRQVTDALARVAYLHDRVRIANGDLTGFDCLVASRQGLFAVARDGKVSRAAWGAFFGIRRHADRLYVFEAGDRPSSPSAQGRIISLSLIGGQLGDPRVVVRGLDNNCHQLAIFDDCLHVVDTVNQRILRFTLDGAAIDSKPLLGPTHDRSDTDNYHHVNSIARIGGRVAVMLHNGAGDRDRPSELAWLDRDWSVAERHTLPGQGCHDIVADEQGRLWHCGSRAGEIINSEGLRVKISPLFTRGLALSPAGFVVGYSEFGLRAERTRLAGGIMFLDHEFTVRADVPLDGAPTDLVLLGDTAPTD